MDPDDHPVGVDAGRAGDVMGVKDRGSAAIETAVGVPAFLLFIALIIGAGRIAIARQAVEAAAAEGARSASIERTQAAADHSAKAAAAATLANQQLQCVSTQVVVDTSGFARPVGTPATVSVSITCVVNLSDVAIPGLPGTLPITETISSPIDTYRGR
jgi:Flp pilus assembly protein TadG